MCLPYLHMSLHIAVVMPRSAQLVDRLVPPVLLLVDCHAVSSPWTVVRASTYSSRSHITPIPHRRWPNLDSHSTTQRCLRQLRLGCTSSQEHAPILPQGAHHPLPHGEGTILGLSSMDIAFKLTSHGGMSHHTFLGPHNLSVPTYLCFCLFLFDFSRGDMNRPI